MQQRRVQIDADWNEQADIEHYHNRISISDIIGNSGVPSKEKDGFRIEPKGKSYLIKKGRYYVDGILCENEKDCYAFEQPDLPVLGGQNPCPITVGTYLIYLDVWERHLTYLDDPSIRDIALGEMDTSTRSKIIWQVKPLRIGDIGDSVFDNCSSHSWLRLKEQSLVTLQAVVSKSGYNGLENQLYRVEIHNGGNLDQATFKWSRDNGSIVSKVKSFSPLENKIFVYVDDKDNLLKFASGQWIEVIDDRHELWGIPGTMIQIQNIENHVITFDKNTFKGSPATNITYPQEFHPKIRRWDSSGGLIPITVDGYINIEDGIQVKFSPDLYKTGDYWLIPARTASRNIEWSRNGECPIAMPPNGVIHRYSPLALVEFDQNRIKLITDYRNAFDTTVSITNKLDVDSGISSIILQPMKFKIIGPIYHTCNSVHKHPVPPLVMVGLESYNSNSSVSNMKNSSTVLHMDDLSLLKLLSDRYGHVVGDSNESNQLAEILGLDRYLKTLAIVPPFFKPVLVDIHKFYILVVNYSKIELKLNLRWWAITINRSE